MKTIKVPLIYCFCLLLPVSFFSCGKKWKQPADVYYSFQLGPEEQSPLKFSSGYITIEELEFDGRRKQGENDIAFEYKLEGGHTIHLAKGATASGITVDIPQGTYTEIDLAIDINTFAGKPSLTLYGTTTDSIGSSVNVRFELNSAERIELEGSAASGASEIVLVEDKASTAVLTLDPAYWFEVVPESMLHEAEVTYENGSPVIVIGKDNNEDIYKMIISRIKDGNKALFN